MRIISEGKNKMNMKKISMYVLTFVSALVVSVCFTFVAKADVTVREGMPSVLLGKYWQATIKDTTYGVKRHQYFYATKDGFVLKHIKGGTLRAKWMIYKKLDDHAYTLNGADSKDVTKAIWIFIKPNHNWTKIRIGYTRLPINTLPKYYPIHYAKTIATRTSKVTAILH